MFKVKKTCPNCGLPYLSLYKALFGTIIFFGCGLIGTGVMGAISHLLKESENATWISMLIGLLCGGIVGMIIVNKKLINPPGIDYCQCTDGV